MTGVQTCALPIYRNDRRGGCVGAFAQPQTSGLGRRRLASGRGSSPRALIRAAPSLALARPSAAAASPLRPAPTRVPSEGKGTRGGGGGKAKPRSGDEAEEPGKISEAGPAAAVSGVTGIWRARRKHCSRRRQGCSVPRALAARPELFSRFAPCPAGEAKGPEKGRHGPPAADVGRELGARPPSQGFRFTGRHP